MTAGLGARRSALGFLLVVLAATAGAQSDSSWRQVSAAGDSARLRGDWKSYQRYAGILYKELNGHPGTILAQARAAAQLRDTAMAMRWLKMYAATGLVRDMDADSLLAPVRSGPGWKELLARIAKNREAVGKPTVAFTAPDSEFVSEDIAYDSATKRFFLSSIRERKIAVWQNGKFSDFVAEARDSIWAVLGIDAEPRRGALWATTAGMPETRALAVDDSGSSAVMRYDLKTGALQKRYDMPDDSSDHVLGDMALGRNGDVYVSDAISGAFYTIRADRDSLVMLVRPGTLASPQQPVATPDGKRIFVADYIRGIAIVERATGKVSWLANDAHAALNGTDGLTIVGHSLIAIQNGVSPQRVIRLDLDNAMTKIVRWSTLAANLPQLKEPTHGVQVGDKFYFIATSGWDRFDPDGTIPKGAVLERPVVMVLDIK